MIRVTVRLLRQGRLLGHGLLDVPVDHAAVAPVLEHHWVLALGNGAGVGFCEIAFTIMPPRHQGNSGIVIAMALLGLIEARMEAHLTARKAGV
jgi:hypothetical protein